VIPDYRFIILFAGGQEVSLGICLPDMQCFFFSPAASSLTGKERRRFEQEQIIALGGKVTVHAV